MIRQVASALACGPQIASHPLSTSDYSFISCQPDCRRVLFEKQSENTHDTAGYLTQYFPLLFLALIVIYRSSVGFIYANLRWDSKIMHNMSHQLAVAPLVSTPGTLGYYGIPCHCKSQVSFIMFHTREAMNYVHSEVLINHAHNKLFIELPVQAYHERIHFVSVLVELHQEVGDL